MTDSNENDDKPEEKKGKKPLRLSQPGKLELKKTVTAGQVRQNFSHGRSKMVTVEVRKKRTFRPDSGGSMHEVNQKSTGAKSEAEEVFARPAAPVVEEDFDNLTAQEKEARTRALEEARRREQEEQEAQKVRDKMASEKAAEAQEVNEAAPADSTPVARELTPDELAAQQIGLTIISQPEPAQTDDATSAAKKTETTERKGGKRKDKDKDKDKEKEKRVAPPRRGDDSRRRSGKLTIAEALGGGEERTRSLAAVKRQREKEKVKQQQARAEGGKIMREVIVPETITVQELANRMAERGAAVVKSLMQLGVMATITQSIDADTAELVVSEFGHKVKRVSDADVEIGLADTTEDDANLKSRAPVVTVMGHVDHGKTSLLDALRATDIAGGEAGGITQHIGAYQVTMESGQKITFIDTPGHAAFTDMRARGAKVTDIVVLVVAADDSVMPQTIEAIHHAQAAEVPIIVAINKCDLPAADANRVRTELLQHNVQVEEMGGDVLSIEVSAKKRMNLDKLEEAILLQSELLDLKANPDRLAQGVIVESKMERGRGSVATVLVQRGTLKAGDTFVAGAEWGRVRALIDDHGNPVEAAGPAVPVEVLGLNGTPEAGDEVVVVENETRAREVSAYRQRQRSDKKAAAGARGTLEQMFEKIQDGEAQSLPIVIKADVHGSLEAILAAMENMATDEVRVQVLHSAVGGINESDIILARASGGIVIGFNVRANAQARDLAKRDGVDIRYYSIIYDVTDDMKKMLSGMLAPTLKENLLGYAEVREVFSVSKVGKVAGCMVTDGTVKRGAKVRLLRDDVVVHEGDLSQLKRFKDDAKEVKEGMECGMSFANYDDIKVGDRIECFDVEEIAREL